MRPRNTQAQLVEAAQTAPQERDRDLVQREVTVAAREDAIEVREQQQLLKEKELREVLPPPSTCLFPHLARIDGLHTWQRGLECFDDGLLRHDA